jgi:hypothetical protein
MSGIIADDIAAVFPDRPELLVGRGLQTHLAHESNIRRGWS